MEMMLTCPKCGHKPAITPSDKIYLFYLQEPKCPKCNTTLSNPFWFDIVRIATVLGVTFWSASFIHDNWDVTSGLIIIISLIVSNFLYYALGLIALFLIPLRQHWKTT